MLKIRLIRKVTNAADRNSDRWYVKTVKLPAIPPLESIVIIGGKHFYARSVKMIEDDTTVTVELAPEHGTFKGSDFGTLCRRMEQCGFEAGEP